MDAVVVPDVRCQCRAASAPRARLKSRQLPAHAGNAGADQGLVADSLREKLIKVGAKLVSHGRYVAFQMAEVAIPRAMVDEILRLIAELRPPPDPVPA